jgi:hypothetical protein
MWAGEGCASVEGGSLQHSATTCQRLCRFAASITLSRLTKTMSDTSSQPETKPEAAVAERGVVPAVPAVDAVKVERPTPDPTRYGDWEKNGRCIDF